MYYATTEKDGHKFVGFVPKTSGFELSPDERAFVVDKLPVEGEWIEGVWSYIDEDFEDILDKMENLEEDKKAINFLEECVEEGLLDDD